MSDCVTTADLSFTKTRVFPPGEILSAYCVTIAYFVRQVLGALMAHTGSKDSAEVDGALRVLQCLTGSLDDATRLAPFLPFVKGALDFIESLKLSQVTYQHPWPSARTHTHTACSVLLCRGVVTPPLART